MTAHTHQRSAVTFEPQTGGLTMVPTRLALATLSSSRRWWAFLFVFVPLGFLGGSFWISPQIANGIMGLCGFLALVLWSVSYYNYDRPRVRIDGGARSLTVVYENAGRQERAVDLKRVESVSVHTLGSMALIRIEGHTFSPFERFLLPEPFLVSAERVPAALDALHAAGVAVPETGSETDDGRSLETSVRLAVTPLVLVGVPVSALFAFGQSILVTNGTVIMVILGLVAIAREL